MRIMETIQILRKLFWPIFSGIVFIAILINDSYALVSNLYLHPQTWKIILAIFFLVSLIVSLIRILLPILREHERQQKEEARRKKEIKVISGNFQELETKVKKLEEEGQPVSVYTFQQISQSTNAISQAMRELDRAIETKLKEDKKDG